MTKLASPFPKPLPLEFRALRDLCRSWIKYVVEVRETPRRQRLDFVRSESGAYETVYMRLLDECHRLGAGKSSEQQAFLERFGDLVRPWTSLESLTQQPANILVDLIRQTQLVESALHCPARAPEWLRKAALWVFTAAFLLLVVPALWQYFLPNEASLFGRTLQAKQKISLFLDRATEKEQTVALAAVVVISGIAILWGSRRY
ncbi:MAG: hypothetical protein U0939_07695 [Pirellulales bacterium]